MASLNSCNFIGNIGKIETRYLSSGDPVTNCSLAVNESWNDKNGEKQERTEWVNVTAYKKLSEIMDKYCTVGMQIYISGKMLTRKYTDKNGVDRYATDIIANDMKMLGGKSDSGKSGEQSKPANNNTNNDDFDDLPF